MRIEAVDGLGPPGPGEVVFRASRLAFGFTAFAVLVIGLGIGWAAVAWWWVLWIGLGFYVLIFVPVACVAFLRTWSRDNWTMRIGGRGVVVRRRTWWNARAEGDAGVAAVLGWDEIASARRVEEVVREKRGRSRRPVTWRRKSLELELAGIDAVGLMVAVEEAGKKAERKGRGVRASVRHTPVFFGAESETGGRLRVVFGGRADATSPGLTRGLVECAKRVEVLEGVALDEGEVVERLGERRG